MDLISVNLLPVEVLGITLVEVVPGKMRVVLEIHMEFWIVEYTIDLVILYLFTVLLDGLLKRMDPVDDRWPHQRRVFEILAENWICGHNDSLLRCFVITLNLIFLLLDLKHILKEFVIIFDIRSRKFNRIFNLQVFSGFDYPSFSFSCF